MGRITLFISDSCNYCQRAKRALEDRSIPYEVISVASHPGECYKNRPSSEYYHMFWEAWGIRKLLLRHFTQEPHHVPFFSRTTQRTYRTKEGYDLVVGSTYCTPSLLQ